MTSFVPWDQPSHVTLVRNLAAEAGRGELEAQRARLDLADAIVAASAAGVDVVTLAEAAGVSRQRVYQILRQVKESGGI